jgi:dTMP kinase
MKGKFIVFEGPDHSGKTTQIEIYKRHIAENNPELDKKTIFTREPGGRGNKVTEEIRKILLNPENNMNPLTEAYLYAASRAEHVFHINEWLNDSFDVVCDRYVYSSYIYQGIARDLGVDTVQRINRVAMQNTYPNTIIYFKMNIDTYLERKLQAKSLDRLEQNDIEFFKKVIEGYDKLFLDIMQYCTNIHVIDAKDNIDSIQEQIRKVLNS